MKSLVFLLYFFIVFQSEGQDLSSAQLLDNAIAYHDPLGNWKSFNGVLHVTMVTPNKSNRESEIHINLADDYFFLKATRDSVETKYTLKQGKCTTSITDTISLNNKRTPCETAKLYKNYYMFGNDRKNDLKLSDELWRSNLRSPMTNMFQSRLYNMVIGADQKFVAFYT